MDTKIHKIAAEQEETIQSLVTKSDIQLVKEKFYDYAKLTDLKALKDEITPLVTTCRHSLDLFTTEHAQMKEMIRRFDECLSEKANKMSLIELEHRINDNFLHNSKWDDLQEKFSSLTSEITSQFG